MDDITIDSFKFNCYYPFLSSTSYHPSPNGIFLYKYYIINHSFLFTRNKHHNSSLITNRLVRVILMTIINFIFSATF